MARLKDVMTPTVEIISPDATIKEAARHMHEGDFGMMPVGEDGRVIGTVSDRDIAVRAVGEGKGPDTKVRDVMSKGVIWAFDTDTVENAAEIMAEHQVRRLPIVSADRRLVGIVALGDFAVETSDLGPATAALSEISKPA